MPTTNPPSQTTRDPNVYAILHRAGRSWRGLITRIVGGGRAPELIAVREFPLDPGTTLEGWLDEYQVSEVIGVLPASAVICRTCQLPDAAEDQLEPALRLQAEAHLFGIAPAHRLAMAVLPAGRGESGRAGLILAWPESAQVAAPPTGRRISWAPDIAGLAALLSTLRPTRPLMWVDREPGAIAMALTHSGGATFRAVREDADDDELWSKSIGRALAETALNHDHSAAFVEEIVRNTEEKIRGIRPGEARLLAPQEVIDQARSRMGRLGNQTEAQTEGWWSTYGVTVGVALARAGTLAPLTQMEDDPPKERPSILRRTVAALSTPQHATVTVIACVLLLMFGTMVFNGLQYAVLQWRYSDIDDRLAAVNLTQDKIEVYRELERSGWSVTKIFSDIAANTPEGIELEQMRITQQQTFTVSGRALPPDGATSATELVTIMQSNLIDSGVFESITLRWGDRDAYGAVEFDLSARLKQPNRHVDYDEDRDFRTKPLRVRRFGPPPETERETVAGGVEVPEFDVQGSGDTPPGETRTASDRDPRPGGSAGDPDDRRAEAGRESGRTGGREPGDTGSRFGDAADPGATDTRMPASFDVPDPMSEEEIMALSEAEVRDRLVRVSQARTYARNRGNDELHAQFAKEFNLLMDRMRGDR